MYIYTRILQRNICLHINIHTHIMYIYIYIYLFIYLFKIYVLIYLQSYFRFYLAVAEGGAVPKVSLQKTIAHRGPCSLGEARKFDRFSNISVSLSLSLPLLLYVSMYVDVSSVATASRTIVFGCNGDVSKTGISKAGAFCGLWKTDTGSL